MRERAAAVGGPLEAGPREGGGFRVHARLPSGEDRP
jgi:signal transduction histidine kinase